MSPMYLHHRYGFSFISLKISSNTFAIKNTLYGGAKFVPIAVLHYFCFIIKSKHIALKNNLSKFYLLR